MSCTVYTEMLEGVARKISFALVFCSAIGWIAFSAGFGIRNEWLSEVSGENVVHVAYFMQWCFAVSAVVLCLTAFIHLSCGNKCTAVCTTLVLPFFLVSAGGVLQIDGQYLYEYYKNGTVDYANHVPAEFAGALVSVVFYWMSMVLWTFHTDKHKGYRAVN